MTDGPDQGLAPPPSRPSTPGEAWRELQRGNARFVTGFHEHPNQDAATRAVTAAGQRPFAMIFGCADSRVAAEIIFDRGLGDLFVIRTAGHVVDVAVLGSVEFGISELGTPLVVVLGHAGCGAVGATIQAVRSGVMPTGYVRDLVERVMPSVLTGRAAGLVTPEELEAEHVRHTARLLADRSRVLAEAIADGRVAVVGATYALARGRVGLVDSVGRLDVPGD